MPRTYRVRNNPVGSFVGGIVGICVLVFGLSHFGLGDGGGFVFLWASVVIGGVLVSFYNAFSARGVADKIVETDELENPALAPPLDAAARLRQLGDLRRQGLITAAEYDQRQAEIVRRL